MKPVIALLRQIGFRLIIYLDEILLLMAESRYLALFQAASTLNLPEKLGFLGNYKKSQLDPVQQLEFLGVVVDTRETFTFTCQAKNWERFGRSAKRL